MVVQGKPASNQQVRHLYHSEQLHEVKQRGEIGLELALLHLPLLKCCSNEAMELL